MTLKDIRDEMGSASSLVSLSALYKGGTYVPNTSATSNIPLSGTIFVSQFYGTRKWSYTNCNYTPEHQLAELAPGANVQDANAKTIWIDPLQYTLYPILSFPVNFQYIYKNTTGAILPTKVYILQDDTTTITLNSGYTSNLTYTGTTQIRDMSLSIGANLISVETTNTGGGGGMRMALRDSNNTQTYFVSSSNTFVANSRCVVHPNNFYLSSKTTRVASNYTIVQLGSDPDVQLRLCSLNVFSASTSFYAQERLQDFATVTIAFEFYIPTTAQADAMWFQMGGTSYATNESTSYGGFLVSIGVYGTKNIALRNDSGIVVQYNTSTVTQNAWQNLWVRYTRTTGLWEVNYGGTQIISYTNTNNSLWLNTSSSYWSFGARTGGSAGDFYVRRLQIYGR